MNVYPLPRIDDMLDSLSEACMFSTLDLASGFWQVEVEEPSHEKNAFITTMVCLSLRKCLLDLPMHRQHSST